MSGEGRQAVESMTRDEFATAYAERSGTTVEWLRQHGRVAIPCECGDTICAGWQMAHVEPPDDRGR